MATLEEIKPYIDRRIGLCGHVFLDHMVNDRNSPNGQDYSGKDFYIYPSKERGYYRLDIPDFETPWDRKTSRAPRQEYLLAWSDVLRVLGQIPGRFGKPYLETNEWHLHVYKPRHPRKQP